MRWLIYVSLPAFLLMAAIWAMLATETGLRVALMLSEPVVGSQFFVQRSEGSLSGPLRWRGIRISTDASDIEISELDFDWTMSALMLGELKVARIELNGVSVRLKDSAKPEEPETETAVADAISLPKTHFARVAVKQLTIYDAKGAVSFSADRIQLAGGTDEEDIQLSELTVALPGQGEFQVTADLRLSQTLLEIERLHLLHDSDQLDARLLGWFNYASQEMDLSLSWRRLAWPLQQPEFLQQSAGLVEIKGFPNAWVASAQAELETTDPQFSSGQMQLRGRGDLSQASVKELEWRSSALDLALAADLNWQAGFIAEAKLELKRLDTTQASPDWAAKLQGTSLLKFELSPQPSVSPKWLASLDSLNVGGEWLGRPLKLVGELQANSEIIEFRKFQLNSGQSVAHLVGKFALPNAENLPSVADTKGSDLALQLDSPDLGDWLPEAQGQLQAKVNMSGALKRPTLEFNGRWQGFKLTALSSETGEFQGQIDLADSHPGKQPLDMAIKLGNVKFADRSFESIAIDLDGSVAKHRLSVNAHSPTKQAQNQQSQFDELAFEMNGGGDLRAGREQWQFQWLQARLYAEELGLWSLVKPSESVGGLVSRQGLSLTKSCFVSRLQSADTEVESAPRVCISAQEKNEGKPQTLNWGLNHFSLKQWESFLPEDTSLNGRVSGQIELIIDQQLLRGQAFFQTSAIDLSVTNRAGGADNTVSLATFAPGEMRLDLSDQQVTFGMRLPIQDSLGEQVPSKLAGVFIQGTLGLPPGWMQSDSLAEKTSLQATLDVKLPELDWVSSLLPSVIDMDGELQGQYEFSGSLAQPRFSGALNLQNAAIELDQPGIRIQPLSLSLSSDRPDQIALTGQAVSGGALDFSGRYLVDQQQLNLSLAGQNFIVIDVPESTIAVSPDIALNLDVSKRSGELTGQLTVPSARLMPSDIQSEGAVTVSADERLVGQGQIPADPWKISADLALAVGPEVHFEGFGLTADFEGALKLKQEAGQAATASGELRIVNGHYKAYGQDLAIEQGRVIFAGGLVTDPGLDVRAQRVPDENVVVGLRVTGPLRKPRFALFSQPSMGQTETLSWLVLGRAPDDSSEAGGAALTQAALALGLKGGNFLAKEVGERLGVDEVGIESRPGSQSDQAALVLGKYLNPDLYVSYGIGLFEPVYNLRIRYRLSRRWTLQTESGIHSGGDFVYSIERD